MAKRANGIAEFTTDGNMMAWSFGEIGEVSVQCFDFFPDYMQLSEVQKGIIYNGLKQKMADSIAGCVTTAARYEKMVRTAKALANGEWSSRGDSVEAERIIVAAGIVQVTGKPVDAVRAYLADKSKKDLAKIAASSKFAVAIANFRAAQTGVPKDTSEMESEIDAL